jgi:hypothetical protein
MKKITTIKKVLLILCLAFPLSCDYLDVIPDNVSSL